MKRLLLFSAAILALTGCNSQGEVDNTGRNSRDRHSQNLTPPDQASDKADLKITKTIRRLLVRDSTLSTNAKNIKIITINGKVTLRGVVENSGEKASIEAIARKVQGVTDVNNQLEINNDLRGKA